MALPDNSTCHLDEGYYGCEIGIRPDTIVYLACSIAVNFKDKQKELSQILGDKFDYIADWTDGNLVWSHISDTITAIDRIILSILDKQEPILLQPIWKTNGKSPKLSDNCLYVFVWSNFAFTQLFLDVAREENFLQTIGLQEKSGLLFGYLKCFMTFQNTDKSIIIKS